MTELTENELAHTLRTVYRHMGLGPDIRDRLVSALVELQVRRMDAAASARKASPAELEKFDANEECYVCTLPRWDEVHDPKNYGERAHSFARHPSPPVVKHLAKGDTEDDLCATCEKPRSAHPAANQHAFVKSGRKVTEEDKAKCHECAQPRWLHSTLNHKFLPWPTYAPPSVATVQQAQGNSTPARPHVVPDPGDIDLHDFTWIVNNLGELGVKVRNTYVFFHDGRAIRYTTEPIPFATKLCWRPVQLNEYGIIRPCNTDWEGNYYTHGEGWQELPLAEF